MTRPKTRTAARTLPMKSWMNWTALLSLGVGVIMAGAVRAQDTGTTVSHGYSFYGDLSYPADYPHFDYVNPEAPKGGEIAIAFVGSLDSMNPYSGKGRAHLFSVFGYESLLGEAPSDGLPADQYSEAYCLLFESRSEEHTSELQSLTKLVCRLLLEKKNNVTKESVIASD